MEFNVVQVLFLLAAPALAQWSCAKSKIAEALSAVALCYIFGIVFGNLPWITVNTKISETAAGVAVLLAIPLLLFSVDLVAWLKSAGVTLRASMICFFSTGLVATTAGWFFHDRIPDSYPIAAALAAVYTGGTPSMFAVAQAVDLKPDLLIATNLSDMFFSGPLYFVIIAVGWKLLGYVLHKPERNDDVEFKHDADVTVPWTMLLKGFLLAAAVAGVAIGIGQLVPQSWRDVSIILMVSTFGIALSLVPRIRGMGGNYVIGDYILLIFCTSIGSMADLRQVGETNPLILLMVATVFLSTTALEIILFRLFKVDRDTAVVAMVGSTYSPAFVGPVAARLRNKDALVSGITVGLVGYAIANYLGIGVHALLTYLGR